MSRRKGTVTVAVVAATEVILRVWPKLAPLIHAAMPSSMVGPLGATSPVVIVTTVPAAEAAELVVRLRAAPVVLLPDIRSL